MPPVFRRDVVGQQHIPILGEAGARRLVLRPVLLQEVVEGLGCRVPRLGEPDLVKVALRLGLESLGHLVEYVFRLVNPAPLLLGRRKDLPESGLEAKGPVTDAELRRLREPPLLEIEEQLLPALLALADAVDDGDQFLPAIGRGSHQDEQALLLVAIVFQRHVHVNAVGPDIHVLLVGEVATAPVLVLLAPLVLEADDDIRTEALGILADQRLQSRTPPGTLPIGWTTLAANRKTSFGGVFFLPVVGCCW